MLQTLTDTKLLESLGNRQQIELLFTSSNAIQMFLVTNLTTMLKDLLPSTLLAIYYSLIRCQHVIVLLTNESWNNQRWSHAVSSAIRAGKKIVTIHDATSVKRFPSELPEAIRPVLHEIAIKFIHQRAKACWSKIIKRINKTGVVWINHFLC